MRDLLTFKRTAIIVVMVALGAIALVTYFNKAPKIDCSPPWLEHPTVSVYNAALDDEEYTVDLSIQGAPFPSTTRARGALDGSPPRS